MADIQQTALLVFDIDEQPAVNSIKTWREANAQLRKERDAVNVSTKEGKELVDKLNTTIDKNNKLIKDNSSALEKQRQNVGNYSKSIQEAAGNLNIMGTNVGGLATKLASFLNPLTAAVGIVTALGAAYASSAVGANDLASAQNNLKAGLDTFLNRFGNATDGDLFDRWSKRLNIASINLTTNTKKEAAAIKEAVAIAQIELKTLRELEFDRIEATGRQKVREKEAENARLIRDNQENSFTQRLEASEQVAKSIQGIETETVGILQKQINALISYGENTGAIVNGEIRDRELKLEILKLQNEIADKQEFVSGKLTENVTAQRAITKELKAQNDLTVGANKADRRKGNTGKLTVGGLPSATGTLAGDAATQEIKLSREITGVVVSDNRIKQESAEDYYNRLFALQDQQAGAARDLAGTLADIADEGTAAQKALALTTIAINSGIGVSEAVKAGARIPWPGNLSAILSGITAVLAGIAQAKSLLGFAEGGWTGPGNKYKAVGVVHADEYVTPKHIVHSPAAQPHLAALERMRTGYADGGFVTNSNMQSSRDAMIMANALKNLPAPIVGVREITAVQKRVQVKENVTRQ